jgi:hypothetical protein
VDHQHGVAIEEAWDLKVFLPGDKADQIVATEGVIDLDEEQNFRDRHSDLLGIGDKVDLNVAML